MDAKAGVFSSLPFSRSFISFHLTYSERIQVILVVQLMDLFAIKVVEIGEFGKNRLGKQKWPVRFFFWSAWFSVLNYLDSSENRALAANQSDDCRATTLFTIGLNSAKVWNRGFNWPVFGVRMHKKSPNVVALRLDLFALQWLKSVNSAKIDWEHCQKTTIKETLIEVYEGPHTSDK